jgi:hypothetical protein
LLLAGNATGLRSLAQETATQLRVLTQHGRLQVGLERLDPATQGGAPRIPTASNRALPLDTVATGTPADICTIDNSESRPSSFASETGTPDHPALASKNVEAHSLSATRILPHR